jgi:hypothetical protein
MIQSFGKLFSKNDRLYKIVILTIPFILNFKTARNGEDKTPVTGDGRKHVVEPLPEFVLDLPPSSAI